jgi:hypothetical protein
MISKNHRQNHDFQLAYFLAGSCHTPDAAYALLQEQREDRMMAIENYRVSEKRTKAKLFRAIALRESRDEADRLDAVADIEEIENNARQGGVLYQAACDEVTFIDECLAKIGPLRKYGHLSDAAACQAMQREEWRLELIRRAENFLATIGTIPADDFNTMRMHPDFGESILPRINTIREGLQAGKMPFLVEDSPITKLLTI